MAWRCRIITRRRRSFRLAAARRRRRFSRPQARLLAYLEEQSVEATIDFDEAPATYTAPPSIVYDGAKNLAAAATVCAAFVCPADSTLGRVSGSEFAATNYAANAGSGVAGGTLATADGVFLLGVAVRIKDITDGTSHTAAFCERTLGAGNEYAADFGDAARSMREIPGATTPDAAVCAASAAGTWNQERGAKWIVGNYGNTLYNHALDAERGRLRLPQRDAAERANGRPQRASGRRQHAVLRLERAICRRRRRPGDMAGAGDARRQRAGAAGGMNGECAAAAAQDVEIRIGRRAVSR